MTSTDLQNGQAGATLGNPPPAPEPGQAPRLKTRETGGNPRSWALVFRGGDEVMSGLTDFATREGLTGGHLSGIGALQSAGYETVPPGAKLKVSVGNGMKGAQVTRVFEVDTSGAAERVPQRSFGDAPRPQRRAPDPSTAVQVSGSVKWFDDNKGFGFVQSNDGGKDVFVHISILGPSGVQHLAEGQAVNMRVVDTPKGREALSISLA